MTAGLSLGVGLCALALSGAPWKTGVPWGDAEPLPSCPSNGPQWSGFSRVSGLLLGLLGPCVSADSAYGPMTFVATSLKSFTFLADLGREEGSPISQFPQFPCQKEAWWCPAGPLLGSSWPACPRHPRSDLSRVPGHRLLLVREALSPPAPWVRQGSRPALWKRPSKQEAPSLHCFGSRIHSISLSGALSLA